MTDTTTPTPSPPSAAPLEAVSAIEAAIVGVCYHTGHHFSLDAHEVYAYETGHQDAIDAAIAAIRPLVTALADRAERAEADNRGLREQLDEIRKMKPLAFAFYLPKGDQADFEYLLFAKRNDAEDRADEFEERGHARGEVIPLYPMPDVDAVPLVGRLPGTDGYRATSAERTGREGPQ